MKTTLLFFLLFLSIVNLSKAGYWGFEGKRDAYINRVWEYNLDNFNEENYIRAVKTLFDSFETLTGQRLTPGAKRRVGIKIDSQGGVGMSTPKPLVNAVITALRSKGYQTNEIFLIDINESDLRAAGFIPPLSRRKEGNFFKATPVFILDSGQYYDPDWFYENPLAYPWRKPSSSDSINNTFNLEEEQKNRKSLLPKVLIDGVDFWINLPVVTDHPTLGIKGSLANATLWNVSNGERFFFSATNAALAAAEIAAIPELLSNWALTLMPLEYYQFIGGPAFNARYTRSEKYLWMSVNTVLLDALMLKKMNLARQNDSFPLIKNISVFRYAEDVGVGSADIDSIEWVLLNEKLKDKE